MRKFTIAIVVLVLSTPLPAVGGIGVSLVLENQDSLGAYRQIRSESK